MRTRVGHSFIKQVMAETGAIFGGEHSGALLLPRQLAGRLRLIAALVVLEQLCRSRRAAVGAAQAVRALRAVGRDQHDGRRPAGGDRAGRRARTADAEQDRLDGLTVDLGDWWFNLRPSNTEPLLRLNLEAADAARVRCSHRRGAGPHPSREREPGDPEETSTWRSTRSCSRSWPAPRTRARCSTSPTRPSLYNPRLKRRYAVRDDIPIMLIDEAETVDDAEHERLVAKAEADGDPARPSTA